MVTKNSVRYVYYCVISFILLSLLNTATFSQNNEYFKYFSTFSTAGKRPGLMSNPQGMAFSPNGKYLAVSDTDNNRILILSVNQNLNSTDTLKLKKVIGGLWPTDNIVTPYNSADKYRERDFLSGNNTNPLIGRAYHGLQNKERPANLIPMDKFNLPQGICWLGTNTILVADTQNHRIKAISANGKVKFIIGQEGWKNGYFRFPLGIYADCNKNIYITEPRSKYIRGLGLDFAQRLRVQGNRLQIFNKKLKVVKRLGHMHHMSGRDYRQFKDLTRVWVSDKGDIYLADNGNHRVMVFDKNLKKKVELAKWPYYKLRYPNGIDGSKNGRIAITDTGNNKVIILSPNYKIMQIIGGFGIKHGRFSKPKEAKFGPGGNLYVLDSANCRIEIFKGPYVKEFPKCKKPKKVILPKKKVLPTNLPKAKPQFSY